MAADPRRRVGLHEPRPGGDAAGDAAAGAAGRAAARRPPDQVGTLDLLIDETGNVEQVKLTSPANRYQERMLVSHAKSWKFKPATRDGHPVKYRTRVRVTI